MQFDKLNINPASNPAVLDTATWDPNNAWEIAKVLDGRYWQSIQSAAAQGIPLPATDKLTPHSASSARWQGSQFCLATLADGQQLFLEFGSGGGRAVLGEPIGRLSLGEGEPDQLAVYPTDMETVANYVGSINPEKAPKVMGPEPRLGIGSRMTTASWPGIYRAMAVDSFSANAIQNSVREANVLADLLGGRPPELNYGPNLGTFASGHAGSSFEGLWVYGVLEALKSEGPIRYGADADHMQVKRGPGKLEQAKRVLESVRHYTFYTLDVSDILDYQAGQVGPARAAEYLIRKISDANLRQEILAYHQQAHQVAGVTLQLDEAAIGRFVGKYWDALGVIKEMVDYVGHLKGGQTFDLEFAIDEVPQEVTACECITSSEELLFIIRECQRRELPMTHVAPNIGVEKEMDYRCPDGLVGLEQRIRVQTELARQFDLLLDFHSGDDLSAKTRRLIGRATAGYNQFKVSPYLQLLYAETLDDLQPELFRVWWDDTLAFARREAAAGSTLATKGLHLYDTSNNPRPSAQHMVFRHYCFASVGRRNEAGQYVYRERFYDLPPAFYREYGDRLVRYLNELADDLFHQ